MQSLRRTTFEIKTFDFSPIAISELATPSFSAVTASNPAKYFNVEFSSHHPLYPVICELLAHPCEVHVRLIRRFALFSTLSSVCEYDCALLNSSEAIIPLSPSGGPSLLVVHWDGDTQSIAAKRSRGLDTLTNFEREYKLWRFGNHL